VFGGPVQSIHTDVFLGLSHVLQTSAVTGLKHVMVASFQIFSDSSLRITYHCTL